MSAPIYAGGRPFFKGGYRLKNYVEFNKTVVLQPDDTADTIFTINIPNPTSTTSYVSSMLFVTLFQIIGAGGAIAIGEGVSSAQFNVLVTRTANLAAVIAISAAINAANVSVAGGDTSVAVTLTNVAVAGANTAAQTFAMQTTPDDDTTVGPTFTIVANVQCMNAGLGVTFS